MSQADIETLRLGYEAMNRGDLDGALRVAHPDIEWKTADRHPLAGTYRGHDEVRRFFEETREAFEEVTVLPEEFIQCDDRIAVFVLMRSRPMDSSVAVEIRIAHLWTMRDGKAARCEVFPERERALEAAGLRE